VLEAPAQHALEGEHAAEGVLVGEGRGQAPVAEALEVEQLAGGIDLPGGGPRPRARRGHAAGGVAGPEVPALRRLDVEVQLDLGVVEVVAEVALALEEVGAVGRK